MADFRDVIADGAGSFRGVPFLITETVTQKGGRRVVKREYPRRDDGGADDLGRRLRERSFSCIVIGDDYIDKRDALIEALDEDGPGELVHPLYGTIQAQIDSWESSENLKEQGVCNFTISFFPPMETTAPVEKRDTAKASKKAADGFLDKVKDEFAKAWDAGKLGLHDLQTLVAGATQAVNAIYETVSSTLSWVGDVQGIFLECVSFKNSLVDLVTSPFQLAEGFLGLIGSIGDLADVSAVTNAYDLLVSHFQVEPATSSSGAVQVYDNDTNSDVLTFVAPATEQARQNLLALDMFLYQTALVYSATSVTESVTEAVAVAEQRTASRVVTEYAVNAISAEAAQISSDSVVESVVGLSASTTNSTEPDSYDSYSPFESRAVVEEVAQNIGDELDAQVMSAGELGWGASAQSLLLFRLLWLTDIRERAEQLPLAVAVTPAMTETAFVTLNRQCGDCRGWETFTRRNDLVNPLFVPGGRPVEVLNGQ
ncbi:TPA: DNA circularization N-terminal domain-containing protein [Escherichia coli]|nr:DNA circularization N-terminal domain-containing protein [Escherichia coli]